MISRNVVPLSHSSSLRYTIPEHLHTHIQTSLYAYRICAVPVAEREIGALSYPFLGSHARCSSQFHFDPSHCANSTPVLCTCSVCEGELVARRSASAWRGCDRVSRNFYSTIRAARLAPLLTKIMRRHEPVVSGKSIEHTDRRRSSIRIFLLQH